MNHELNHRWLCLTPKRPHTPYKHLSAITLWPQSKHCCPISSTKSLQNLIWLDETWTPQKPWRYALVSGTKIVKADKHPSSAHVIQKMLDWIKIWGIQRLDQHPEHAGFIQANFFSSVVLCYSCDNCICTDCTDCTRAGAVTPLRFPSAIPRKGDKHHWLNRGLMFCSIDWFKRLRHLMTRSPMFECDSQRCVHVVHCCRTFAAPS